MGIKVKAMERNVAFDKKTEKWMFVMQPELYGQLAETKVVEQAALASGLPKGVLQAALAAYGNVVKVWATEGHSIPIPGLGCMRFGLRSTAVDDVNKVSAQLITSRRVVFVPSVGIKQALADTSVNIQTTPATTILAAAHLAAALAPTATTRATAAAHQAATREATRCFSLPPLTI